ncbi:MAG: NHL repeat-containing protein [Armatimonadota bacterium]
MHEKQETVNPKPPRFPGAMVIFTMVAVAALLVTVYLVMHLGDTLNPQNNGLGKEFRYDLTDLRKTDPTLIKYHEVAKFPTGFQQARGICNAANRLYLVGDQAIREFTSAGKLQRTIKLAAPPQCLAVAPNGSFFVGMNDHVEVVNADGSLRKRWSPPGKHPLISSLLVHEKDIWVADAGDRVVVRYDIEGKITAQLGKKDDAHNAPGLVVPGSCLDLAMAPDGLLRVVNPGRHQIEAYTRSGDMESSWGIASAAIEGFSGCCNPTQIAIFPDGRLVTAEKGLPRVKVYGPDGSFAGVVAGPESFAEEEKGLDVTVDATGRIYILDPTANVVRVYLHNEAKQ